MLGSTYKWKTNQHNRKQKVLTRSHLSCGLLKLRRIEIILFCIPEELQDQFCKSENTQNCMHVPGRRQNKKYDSLKDVIELVAI